MRIGILAVQGDFALHQQVLNRLKIENLPVRTPEELKVCDGLIIPGGESTTFMKLMKFYKLDLAIKRFVSKKSVFGTCAGLIIMAGRINNHGVESLNLIDIDVARNAYGRQVDSFIDTLQLSVGRKDITFEGVFIRAPKILRSGEGVKILGYHQTDIVMAETKQCLVTTFHPELTRDTRIHEYFLKKVQNNIRSS